MPSRFDRYRMKRGDPIGDPAYWNRLLKDLDARIAANEDVRGTLEEVIDEGRRVFREKANDVLLPLIDEVYAIANVGVMLRVTSETEHAVSTGGKVMFVDDGQRLRFAPPAYVAVYRGTHPHAAMLGSVVSYDRDTGELVLDIDRVAGSGTYVGWTITPASPSDTAEAIAAVLEARTVTTAARDQAQTSRDEALDYRDAALQARDESNAYTATTLANRNQVAADAAQVAIDTGLASGAAADATSASENAANARDAALAAEVEATAQASAASALVTAAQTARLGAEAAQTIASSARDDVETMRGETLAATASAVSARDAAQVAESGAAAAASTISQVYLGAAASDPVTDLAGAPLQAGATYWSTAAGQIKVYDGTSWVVSVVPVGSEVTSIFGRTGNVGAQVGDYSADKITITPIAGLSGTHVEAVLGSVRAELDAKSDGGHAHAFAELTSKPTTLSGYGITDAYTRADTDGALALKLDASALTGGAVLSAIAEVDGDGSGLDADLVRGFSLGSVGQAVFVANTQAAGRSALGLGSAAIQPSSAFAPTEHAHAFANLTSKPTTLSGYGITDARTATQIAGDIAAAIADKAPTTYVDQQISNLLGGAPAAALDTIAELASALQDNDSDIAAILSQLASKLNAASYTAADVLAKIKTVDGNGSGLDADLVRGLPLSSTSGANTVAQRDSAGDINARLLRSEYTTTSSTIGYFMTQQAVGVSNNYVRPSTPSQVVAALNSVGGMDAATLDGQGAAAYALSSRSISAGTGLTGGGSLAANRTISARVHDQATWNAGTSTTEAAISPAKVKGAIDTRVSGLEATVTSNGGRLTALEEAPPSLGAPGYAVSDITASVAAMTAYQNNTGAPVFIYTNANGGASFEISTNGSAWITLTTSTSYRLATAMVVAPGWYWRLATTSGLERVIEVSM